MALPIEARAALINSLIESLDPAIDEDAEEAWKAEIDRRLHEVDSGAVPLVSWQVASRRSAAGWSGERRTASNPPRRAGGS